MPMLLIIVVVGTAAGFLATRVMRVQTDVPTTIALGIAGAALGWVILRVLVSVTGPLAYVLSAVIGAVALILLWRLLTR
jgi:uncharacterized membrane protein YeaQ/YmgE (transglycosylase-associated protein family)